MSQQFFNTISFSGKDLEKQNAKAAKQEDLILALFKANPDKKLSPSQVHTILGRKYQIYPPITSIRRAITNLTGRLELIKTDDMVPGLYQLPEHTWKYAGTVDMKNFTASPLNGTCTTNKPSFQQLDIFSLTPTAILYDGLGDTPIN